MLQADLTTLPIEIILEILRNVPASAILYLRAVSRSWNLLIKDNEERIYQSLSIYHQFITPNVQSVEDACKSHHNPEWLTDVHTWTEYFVMRSEVERMWSAKGLPRQDIYDNWIANICFPVQCFRIDEKEQTIISISTVGILVVYTLETDSSQRRVLFTLRNKAAPCARMEYSEGFLVFNNRRDEMHIWRRSNDHRQSAPLPGYSPDQFQLASLDNASLCKHPPSQATDSEVASERGRFVPYTRLRPGFGTQIACLVYPILLLVQPWDMEAYVYDIRTSSLIQTLSLNHRSIDETIAAIRHPIKRTGSAKIHDKGIIVCAAGSVLVFPREHDKWRSPGLLLVFPPDVLQLPRTTLTSLTCQSPQGVQTSYRDHAEILMEAHEGENESVQGSALGNLAHNLVRRGVGLHSKISSDGRDLTLLSCDSQVYLNQDFEDALPQEYFAPDTEDLFLQNFGRSAHCIDCKGIAPVYDLALSDGKLGIVTDAGVYIVIIESLHRPPTPAITQATQHSSIHAPFCFAHLLHLPKVKYPLEDIDRMVFKHGSLWIVWGHSGLWADLQMNDERLVRLKFYPEENYLDTDRRAGASKRHLSS